MQGKIYYLYSYSLTHLTKTNRVKIVYLLKGRNSEKGMVNALKGSFVGKGCFLMPEKQNNEMKRIMERWNVKFHTRKIMLID